jgi:hypothetical protein
VSVPFGPPYGEFGTDAAEYRTVGGPTGAIDCFRVTTAPGVI